MRSLIGLMGQFASVYVFCFCFVSFRLWDEMRSNLVTVNHTSSPWIRSSIWCCIRIYLYYPVTEVDRNALTGRPSTSKANMICGPTDSRHLVSCVGCLAWWSTKKKKKKKKANRAHTEPIRQREGTVPTQQVFPPPFLTATPTHVVARHCGGGKELVMCLKHDKWIR